ncbi:MAG TPA: cytochrome C biosynthesis protein [Bacteroidales bacterium]|nr:cytochrome C biosynthesis protein [Bacteroidales bacterium]
MRLFSKYYFFILIFITALYSCTGRPGGNIAETGKLPLIDPDYSGVTIPPNIAPLNFKITEKGSSFFVRFSADPETSFEIRSKNGIISIPERKWKKFLDSNKGMDFNIEIFLRDKRNGWSKFSTITNKIAPEPIDPYITYRLLYPGYESWKEIVIKQRNLESFREKSIIENSLVEENCLNCHSYNNTGNSDNFMFHMRGSLGGTYFYSAGDFKKVNLKTAEMKNGAVYPRWHPSGRFVAFSSNKIVQQFHSVLSKKVEVSDLESSLVLYDVEKNEIMDIKLPDNEKYMDTYPEWSPDGKYLYFCRAPEVGEEFIYDSVRYDLCRVSFDPSTRKTGPLELIFNASENNKSASFPRISPDGNYIVITLHNYGCFPIWHKEADLYEIDLISMKPVAMHLNSDFTDSYHSWSSNSRWLVFSSKRDDGLTARFYISHIEENGTSGKPFIMPQKDPEFYGRFIKSFNLPELSTLEVNVNPGKILEIAKGKTLQAKWAEN